MKQPSEWKIDFERKIDSNGYLLDAETENQLINTRDTIIDADLKEVAQDDQETYCQWIIVYAIKKVLKLRKNSIDWAAIFQDEESQDAE